MLALIYSRVNRNYFKLEIFPLHIPCGTVGGKGFHNGDEQDQIKRKEQDHRSTKRQHTDNIRNYVKN